MPKFSLIGTTHRVHKLLSAICKLVVIIKKTYYHLITSMTIVEGMEKSRLCSVMARAIQALRFSYVHMQQCKQTKWLDTNGTGVI